MTRIKAQDFKDKMKLHWESLQKEANKFFEEVDAHIQEVLTEELNTFDPEKAKQPLVIRVPITKEDHERLHKDMSGGGMYTSVFKMLMSAYSKEGWDISSPPDYHHHGNDSITLKEKITREVKYEGSYRSV
ncbi:MAG: hypothetical protein CL489_10515 [Acidobacteria bacterium]|nr:hypothetical protein [Acidobacteriota bacterium]|tara:strand:- start:940 stop:1332 length:393 start_codon:yes stop_codon:yes gene_type:complete